MSTQIHPSAIIEQGAELADGVQIGPYAYIGGRVKLGEGTVISHHATVDGVTSMGEQNFVHPYAYVGGPTQDMKFTGGHPELIIGSHNNFREFCTVHCATTEQTTTRIGDFNNFLAYVHIAHECQVGNSNVFSNNTTLAGHVMVGNHVGIGGLTAIHQFTRIGDYAFIGGCSAVVKDVPPMMIAAGNHATVAGINKVGLERNGFSVEEIDDAFRAFKVLFVEGHTFDHLPEHLRARVKSQKILDLIIPFIEAKSDRGLIGRK